MIISENKKPTIDDFYRLMAKNDALMNSEAKGRDGYYANRNGTKLEEDVYNALVRTSKNTPFEGSIVLVSGASFPDIIAKKYYGVEVKSTKSNNWTSIGSSILESTRDKDVERIFLTFGKLGAPVQFRSRPYEDCLSGISVTHYPRYQIDMNISKGETIFDKMGVSYDELRRMDNPVEPVSAYYKSKLKPGERLWWASQTDTEEVGAPATVCLWSTLTPNQKTSYTVKGYALFPEILGRSSAKKYQRYALWLATDCSVINTNIRDQFSAGGRTRIMLSSGIIVDVGAAFGRIDKFKELIIDTIMNATEETLRESWQVDTIQQDRITQWCQIASKEAADEILTKEEAFDILVDILSTKEKRLLSK